jgi:3-phenylpropionate/trans-cinnamate dioxygenase ferredoxin reductase subunit
MNQTCVIVGASHAAAQLAPTLRQEGWEGRIIIIGDESYIPYHRPPLSKTFLSGGKGLDDIYIRPMMVYEKADIEFMLNTRVDEIGRAGKRLALNNGESLPYDKLALTVGSRVRKVDLPGSELGGVFYLRDVNDVEQIKTRIASGKKAVIVGGGYIGLETAAVLRKRDMDVTVLEMMERVLQRVTAAEVSAFYDRIHSEEGVKIHCGVGVTAIEGRGDVEKVICNDGSEFEADLVVIGVGILPNVELAAAAGLEVENGICVNEYACTSDPDIVAAGDCTSHHSILYDRAIRLESVQNATEQARVAALSLCGKEKVYDALPWFWSDQFDLKLQIAGLSQGYDEVIIRGDQDNSRSFATFYLKEDVVISVDAVNKAPEFMAGKRLINGKVKMDKAQLADENIPIKELIK